MMNSSVLLKAQSSTLEISLETTDVISGEQLASGSIAVSIDGRGSEFSFMLYDENPLKGGKPIRTEIIKYASEYTFADLAKGVYHVCVMDSDDNLACKKTEILTD